MLSAELISKVRQRYEGKPADEFTAGEMDEVRSLLKELIRDESGLSMEEISGDTPFVDLGLDSVSFLQVFDEVKKAIKLPIPTGELLSFARNTRMNNMNELVKGVFEFLENPRTTYAR